MLGYAFASGQQAATRTPPARLPAPRFQLAYPLPGLPAITIDTELDGQGLALQTARARRLQARILWIDCTANIDRYNAEDKIVSLVRQIAGAGFNTIIFDVKPISGQVAYPSKLAQKITEWKGRKLPVEFDPLRVFVREAKAAGLGLYVSLNAFSEGHRDFKVGPGYGRPEEQTVLYEPQPLVQAGGRQYPALGKPNVLPDSGETLGVFTDALKLPPPMEGRFAVTLGRDGRVVDGFEFGGLGRGVPTIPSQGCALIGDGAAAEFLRESAVPSAEVSFTSEPLFVPISERPEQQIPLMMNPNHPEVQRRAEEIVREVLQNYEVDGVVYDDRLRFAGINADFSQIARDQFERYVGHSVAWPDDVFRYAFTSNFTRGIVPGRYYQDWLNWRAKTIQDFVERIAKTVRAVRPQAQFGVYAGSWYGEYANLGSNYASPELDAGFWYLTNEYRLTGFADKLDFLITGCYYPTATIHEAFSTGVPVGYTVEYAGYLSNQVARDQAWTYAGIMLSQYRNDPAALARALQAACSSTQGVMVFDLSHDIEGFWPVFQQAFRTAAKAPHKAPGLLQDVRKRRSLLDARSPTGRAVKIIQGQAGAGQ